MKNRLTIVVLLLSILLLTACKLEDKDMKNIKDDRSYPDAPAGAVTEIDGMKVLTSKEYRINFPKVEDGYGVEIYNLKESDVTFKKEKPANIKVRGKSYSLLGNYEETFYDAPYHSIKATDYGYLASSEIKTEHGSVFFLQDKYYLNSDDVFIISRQVEVRINNSEDKGFASTVSFMSVETDNGYNDFEYFMPSILYKDTSNMVPGSIASNLDLDRVYVKETRMGLPMVMARSKKTGYALSLFHYQPEISVNGHVGGGISGDVNNDLQYGAIGLTIKPSVSVDFIYPASEGPTTYDAGQGWSNKYHNVEKGYIQRYQVGIIPSHKEDYNDAMVDGYKKAYQALEPEIYDMNLDEIYEQNIEIFTKEYVEYGTGPIKSAGVPWSLSLPDGTIDEGYSFQMGFVGQQLPLGYHLYRYGLDSKNEEITYQGKTIIDFWASPMINSTYFPTVWWDPADNSSGGYRRNYPSFLRCMVDGMEGMLDAYRISKAYGDPQENWYAVVKKFADNLVQIQNDDGSFYRAYKTNGEVETSTVDSRFQGWSKLNTPIAVRFLTKMYEQTGELKYKEAALKAAEYSYVELYEKLGKYVGGTPDNANTVDKEAAVYALYAFNSAYLLTQDEKYLKAAEHAAINALSWTYVYDFAVPAQNAEDAKKNPFADGGVIGFSIIATGHSGADNYSSYSFYETYRLYLLTGDQFFYDAALLLQNNTKLSTDYDGKLGFKYRAMMPEATNVADFQFSTVGTWLPWSGVANIEPIVHLYETFGTNDLRKIKQSYEEQKEEILSYGMGGYDLSR